MSLAACEEVLTPGCLYLAATPIGNLAEISPRLAHVLSSVDLIAAEDTRVSAKLLQHLGLKKPCLSLHAHNETQSSETVLQALQQKQRVALLTDAGTPGIADPGAKLVQLCHQHQIRVIPISGPSAVSSAIAASGLAVPSGGYTFIGFLSRQNKILQTQLQTLVQAEYPVVCFESPLRILATLKKLAQHLPPTRQLCCCRELTKKFETIQRAPLSWWLTNPPRPQGEFTLVIDAATTIERDQQIKQRYQFYQQHSPLAHADILKLLAMEFAINPKRLHYLFDKN